MWVPQIFQCCRQIAEIVHRLSWRGRLWGDQQLTLALSFIFINSGTNTSPSGQALHYHGTWVPVERWLKRSCIYIYQCMLYKPLYKSNKPEAPNCSPGTKSSTGSSTAVPLPPACGATYSPAPQWQLHSLTVQLTVAIIYAHYVYIYWAGKPVYQKSTTSVSTWHAHNACAVLSYFVLHYIVLHYLV